MEGGDRLCMEYFRIGILGRDFLCKEYVFVCTNDDVSWNLMGFGVRRKDADSSDLVPNSSGCQLCVILVSD